LVILSNYFASLYHIYLEKFHIQKFMTIFAIVPKN